MLGYKAQAIENHEKTSPSPYFFISSVSLSPSPPVSSFFVSGTSCPKEGGRFLPVFLAGKCTNTSRFGKGTSILAAESTSLATLIHWPVSQVRSRGG